uniref:Uncharacterized protein n=1 Tax=Ignisphaera aggregans TaxID=334771 RepID=A0A7J2TA59_9CREN
MVNTYLNNAPIYPSEPGDYCRKEEGRAIFIQGFLNIVRLKWVMHGLFKDSQRGVLVKFIKTEKNLYRKNQIF